MDTIARLLQEAIDSYNVWASVKGKQHDYIKDHNDLKGIFYNKLISILSANKSLLKDADAGYLDSKGRWIRNYLLTTDIYCQFVEGSYLKKICFLPYHGSTYGSYKVKQRILEMLIGQQDNVDYNTKTECSMAIANDIVEQVKKYKHVK
jgi:hypothetical protein